MLIEQGSEGVELYIQRIYLQGGKIHIHASREDVTIEFETGTIRISIFGPDGRYAFEAPNHINACVLSNIDFSYTLSINLAEGVSQTQIDQAAQQLLATVATLNTLDTTDDTV